MYIVYSSLSYCPNRCPTTYLLPFVPVFMKIIAWGKGGGGLKSELTSFSTTTFRDFIFTFMECLKGESFKGNRTIADLRYTKKGNISPSTLNFAPIKG